MSRGSTPSGESVSSRSPAKLPSLRINAAANLLRNVFMFAFPLVTFPYTARVLGPSGTGAVSFAISFVEHFALLASLGIPMYGIRAVARVRQDDRALRQTARELFYLHLCASAVVFAGFCATVFLMPPSEFGPRLLLAAGSSLWLAVLGVEWLFQGQEKFVYITLRSMAFSTLSLIGILLLVKDPSHTVEAVVLTVLSSTGGGILNFLKARSILMGGEPVVLDFRRHLRPLGASFLLNFLASVYLSLDMVILGLLTDAQHVGYYAVASKLNRILTSMIASLGSVLLPRMAFYADNGDDAAFAAVLTKSIRVTCLVSIPCVAGFLVLAQDAVGVLVGEAYAPSVLCVRIVVCGLLVSSISNILAWQILFPKGRDGAVLRSLALAAVASVVVNLLLVRHLQHVGSALALLASEVLVFGSLLVAARKDFLSALSWSTLGRQTLAAGAMAVCVLGLRSAFHGLPALVALLACAGSGAALYAGFLVLARDPDALAVLASMPVGRRGES